MADNTVINPGSGGDTVRDVDRGAGAKTQVVQLDFGGVSSNAEYLINAGQKTSLLSIPVVIASDQTPVTVIDPYAILQAQAAYLELAQVRAAALNGFLPVEYPSFLLGAN